MREADVVTSARGGKDSLVSESSQYEEVGRGLGGLYSAETTGKIKPSKSLQRNLFAALI